MARWALTRAEERRAFEEFVNGIIARWQAIRVGELDRRQMRDVREELDREYEAQNGLGTEASVPARQAKISSTART